MNVCHSIAHGLLFIGAAGIAAAAVGDRQEAEAKLNPQPADTTIVAASKHTLPAQSNVPQTSASPSTATADDDDTGSLPSFFSWIAPDAPTPEQLASRATPQQSFVPEHPRPAKPPADNTPKTLPQAYGTAADRAAQDAQWVADFQNWGPFYWTLPPSDNALGMEREFAAGPFWEQRISPTRHDTFLRPLWTEYDHFIEGRNDLHIITPGFTRRRTPLSYEWNVFLFTNYTRLGAADDKAIRTFMIFPLFFWNDNEIQPEKSFWGLFPVYGQINHFFSFQRWDWVAFPLYTRIDSWYNVTRYGVPYPFIQIFTNEAKTARGLYLWPLYGHSEFDGVYERMFWMWPLVYREIDQLHRPVPRVRQGFLPFYAFEHSEHVEDISILMFWGWRNDSKKEYHETRYLWPLWIQGRSPERYVNRWAPFFTHSKTPRIEKWWYMWPAVQHRKVPERGVLMERSQFFYFLYWHETQTSIEHPELPKAEMRFVWPFYASYDNGAGITQRQVLSIFEVFFPHNRAMRDTYSPLFALYRQEADANTGLKRWSLLWNLVGSLETERDNVKTESFHIWPLYQSDSEATQAEQSDSWSILFGLLGWKSTATAQTDTPAAPASETASPVADASIEAENTLTLFWFDIDL